MRRLPIRPRSATTPPKVRGAFRISCESREPLPLRLGRTVQPRRLSPVLAYEAAHSPHPAQGPRGTVSARIRVWALDRSWVWLSVSMRSCASLQMRSVGVDLGRGMDLGRDGKPGYRRSLRIGFKVGPQSGGVCTAMAADPQPYPAQGPHLGQAHR